jgi:hypothetical protein
MFQTTSFRENQNSLSITGFPRKIVYSYCYVYVFLLLCMLCFHRANWHSSATLTEVFPCFFVNCKANARVYLAKTGHGPHSSKLVNCVVLCIVLVDCVVLCIVWV